MSKTPMTQTSAEETNTRLRFRTKGDSCLYSK